MKNRRGRWKQLTAHTGFKAAQRYSCFVLMIAAVFVGVACKPPQIQQSGLTNSAPSAPGAMDIGTILEDEIQRRAMLRHLARELELKVVTSEWSVGEQALRAARLGVGMRALLEGNPPVASGDQIAQALESLRNSLGSGATENPSVSDPDTVLFGELKQRGLTVAGQLLPADLFSDLFLPVYLQARQVIKTSQVADADKQQSLQLLEDQRSRFEDQGELLADLRGSGLMSLDGGLGFGQGAIGVGVGFLPEDFASLTLGALTPRDTQLALNTRLTHLMIQLKNCAEDFEEVNGVVEPLDDPNYVCIPEPPKFVNIEDTDTDFKVGEAVNTSTWYEMTPDVYDKGAEHRREVSWGILSWFEDAKQTLVECEQKGIIQGVEECGSYVEEAIEEAKKKVSGFFQGLAEGTVKAVVAAGDILLTCASGIQQEECAEKLISAGTKLIESEEQKISQATDDVRECFGKEADPEASAASTSLRLDFDQTGPVNPDPTEPDPGSSDPWEDPSGVADDVRDFQNRSKEAAAQCGKAFLETVGITIELAMILGPVALVAVKAARLLIGDLIVSYGSTAVREGLIAAGEEEAAAQVAAAEQAALLDGDTAVADALEENLGGGRNPLENTTDAGGDGGSTDTSGEVDQLDEHIQQLKRDLSNIIKLDEQSLEGEIEEYFSEQKLTDEAKAALRQKYESAVAKLDGGIAGIDAEVSTVTQGLDMANLEAKMQELENLQAELRELKQEVSTKEAKINKSHKGITNETNKINKLNNQKGSLSIQRQQKQAELAQLESQPSIGGGSSAEISKLRDEIAKLDGKINGIDQAIAKSRQNISSLTKDLNSNLAELSNVQQSLGQTEQSISTITDDAAIKDDLVRVENRNKLLAKRRFLEDSRNRWRQRLSDLDLQDRPSFSRTLDLKQKLESKGVEYDYTSGPPGDSTNLAQHLREEPVAHSEGQLNRSIQPGNKGNVMTYGTHSRNAVLKTRTFNLRIDPRVPNPDGAGCPGLCGTLSPEPVTSPVVEEGELISPVENPEQVAKAIQTYKIRVTRPKLVNDGNGAWSASSETETVDFGKSTYDDSLVSSEKMYLNAVESISEEIDSLIEEAEAKLPQGDFKAVLKEAFGDTYDLNKASNSVRVRSVGIVTDANNVSQMVYWESYVTVELVEQRWLIRINTVYPLKGVPWRIQAGAIAPASLRLRPEEGS